MKEFKSNRIERIKETTTTSSSLFDRMGLLHFGAQRNMRAFEVWPKIRSSQVTYKSGENEAIYDTDLLGSTFPYPETYMPALTPGTMSLQRVMIGQYASKNENNQIIKKIYDINNSIVSVSENLSDIYLRLNEIENNITILSIKINLLNVVIDFIDSDKYEIYKPINITIEQKGNENFTACLYDVSLFGYGKCIPDSIDDLKNAIISQFEFLSEQNDVYKLECMPAKQLSFLKRILKPKN